MTLSSTLTFLVGKVVGSDANMELRVNDYAAGRMAMKNILKACAVALVVLIMAPNAAYSQVELPVRVVGGQMQFKRGQCTTMVQVADDCIEGVPCFFWWKVLKAKRRDTTGMGDFKILPSAGLLPLTWMHEFHLPPRSSFPEGVSLTPKPYLMNQLDGMFVPPVCGDWQVKAIPADPPWFQKGCETRTDGSVNCNPLYDNGCRGELIYASTPFKVTCLPEFPSCDPYFWHNARGDRASYHHHADCHQIAGENSQRCNATDDVSNLDAGNKLQCFCDAAGHGIKTDWMRWNYPDKPCPRGWFGPYNGPDWGLEDALFCAKNTMNLSCQPVFDG